MTAAAFSIRFQEIGPPRSGVFGEVENASLPAAWFPAGTAPTIRYLIFGLHNDGSVTVNLSGHELRPEVLRRLEVSFVQGGRFLRISPAGDPDGRDPYQWTPANADVAAFARAVEIGSGDLVTVTLLDSQAASAGITAPSLEAVKVALRLETDETEADSQLSRLVEIGRARVAHEAPDAPADAAHEAIIRAVAYLFEGAAPHYSDAAFWTRSGAAAVLAPWSYPRGSAI